MDPLSLSASIIAITSLTRDVLIVTQSTITKYRDAPDELQQLECQVRELGVITNLLSSLQQSPSFRTQFLNQASITELHQCLQHTSRTLISIKDVFQHEFIQPKNSRRLKWAIYKEAQVSKWKSKLQQHLYSLTVVVSLLTCHCVNELSVSHSKAIGEGSAITAVQYMPRPVTSSPRRKFLSGFHVLSKEWIPLWLLSHVEIDFNISFFDAGRKTRYNRGSFRLRLPSLLRYYMWYIDIVLWSQFFFRVPEFPSISIRHMIPGDSEIFKACKSGDFLRVLELLVAGKAHWSDTTPDNSSLLRYAIESRCSKTVAVLLNHGADASATFGQHSTSPLEWAFAFRQLDIARLLLSNGADVHHISSRGWTPAFNLYDPRPFLDNDEIAPSGDFLGILTANSFNAFDIYDAGGWTCLHRAAAFGDAKDIISFSKVNAPMDTKTRDLLWDPIFCAVLFDNEATFHELRKVQADCLGITDVRGWTLLHLATFAGSVNVVRTLVALGADTQAKSQATALSVPEELKNQALTPYDTAIYHGAATSRIYEECVKAIYPEMDIRESLEQDENDLFWPATET